MSNYKDKFKSIIVPALKKELGYTNDMEVPKIKKIVLNVGLGKGLSDPKFNENVESSLMRITGQKPIKTLSKQSISNFKIRKGLVVGMKITLRGRRMHDFIEKLINITLPRVRDFRGLSQKSIDKQGNLSIGIAEHIAFPEIESDEVERIHGLEITIVASAKNQKEGLALYKILGFPFKEEDKSKD